MPGWTSANRPSRYTSHSGAKSGDVLTVRTPEFWRCKMRSVPAAIRSSTSRITFRYSRPASVTTSRWRSRLNSVGVLDGRLAAHRTRTLAAETANLAVALSLSNP
jgi:hypothetical protein